jgi:septum formation protein
MLSTNSGLKLVLASTSRYRKELLSRLNVAFETASPDIDETPLANEAPAVTASRLAVAKAHAVSAGVEPRLIVGSDQVAVCHGTRLDKPGSHANAVRQLQHSRGRVVVFHTAVALLNTPTGRVQTHTVSTEARIRNLSDAEIERYLAAEPAYDCAGSAKAEGLGIALMETIHSEDPTALIGLPLISLCMMLRSEGIHIP